MRKEHRPKFWPVFLSPIGAVQSSGKIVRIDMRLLGNHKGDENKYKL